jgi:hypothetical protein
MWRPQWRYIYELAGIDCGVNVTFSYPVLGYLLCATRLPDSTSYNVNSRTDYQSNPQTYRHQIFNFRRKAWKKGWSLLTSNSTQVNHMREFRLWSGMRDQYYTTSPQSWRVENNAGRHKFTCIKDQLPRCLYINLGLSWKTAGECGQMFCCTCWRHPNRWETISRIRIIYNMLKEWDFYTGGGEMNDCLERMMMFGKMSL